MDILCLEILVADDRIVCGLVWALVMQSTPISRRLRPNETTITTRQSSSSPSQRSHPIQTPGRRCLSRPWTRSPTSYSWWLTIRTLSWAHSITCQKLEPFSKRAVPFSPTRSSRRPCVAHRAVLCWQGSSYTITASWPTTTTALQVCTTHTLTFLR